MGLLRAPGEAPPRLTETPPGWKHADRKLSDVPSTLDGKEKKKHPSGYNGYKVLLVEGSAAAVAARREGRTMSVNELYTKVSYFTCETHFSLDFSTQTPVLPALLSLCLTPQTRFLHIT